MPSYEGLLEYNTQTKKVVKIEFNFDSKTVTARLTNDRKKLFIAEQGGHLKTVDLNTMQLCQSYKMELGPHTAKYQMGYYKESTKIFSKVILM